MAIIKGFQKTSLIDYPGKISAIIFTSGCNMRCPFCQNPDLVIDNNQMPNLAMDKIIKFLEQRKQWLDGVCITGGEPLLTPDIIDIITAIRKIPLLVKLDTNGLNPQLLEEIIKLKIVDYLAMDIKSDKAHYDAASGIKVDIEKVSKSIELIKNSNIEYEFRSTIVPDFFDEKIVDNIGNWLQGSKLFCLQQFRSSVPLFNKDFEGKEPYLPDVLEKFKKILEKYVDKVEIRN